MYLHDVAQRLYDSEINFCVSTFWDGGFDWKLGDEMNGFDASGSCKTLNDAAVELHNAACKHYPKSSYARLYESKRN